MAYIPPHLRRASQSSKSTAAPPQESGPGPYSPRRLSQTHTHPPKQPLYTRDEIHEHFWPLEPTTSPEGRSHTADHSTLNASHDHPDSLRYVILHHDANPRWKSDKIIFVKSNLPLLGLDPSIFHNNRRQPSSGDVEQLDKVIIGDQEQSAATAVAQSTTPPANPIHVFEQIRRGQGGRTFRFLGFYKIVQLEHLAPRSEALVRMMQQKWESPPSLPSSSSSPSSSAAAGRWANLKSPPRQPKQRDPEKWAESLSVPWAVVRFEPVTDEELKAPDIKVNNEEGDNGPMRREKKGEDGGKAEEGKSVNEMLRDLRMGGDGGGDNKGQDG